MFVASFALLITFGTIGFKTLPGLYTGEPLTWVDALFTTTSAVCVTGLTVVDTATYFTFWGQAYILLLIQLGGLGVLAFTSLIIVALGRRLSLRQEALSTGSLEVAPHIDPRRLTLDVVRFTFFFEGIGALALYLAWIRTFGWKDAAWHAVFHSISAFCNAGFSTFSDNLMGLQRSPFSLAVIMSLIVLGGIGFLTLEEIFLRYQAGRTQQIFRVSLHSRIVLTTTAILLVGGCVLFTIFEWDQTLGELPFFHKVTNAMFMSVTCRTAGYYSINYGQATDSSNFLTILLMAIGGSPGSTAGGMKTTTFALIGLLAWSRWRGEELPSVAGRSLRKEATERAVGLFVIAFGVVTAGVFVLNASERFSEMDSSFLARMFEASSAFNTVGLTMDLTPSLTALGKLTNVALMFLGRVGPLTFAAALMLRRRKSDSIRYSFEDVVVG